MLKTRPSLLETAEKLRPRFLPGVGVRHSFRKEKRNKVTANICQPKRAEKTEARPGTGVTDTSDAEIFHPGF